jgi:hypothetical protein
MKAKEAVQSATLPYSSVEHLLSIPLPELFLEHKKRTGKKIPTIAKELNIIKEVLYKWEKGTKPSNMFDHLRIISYLTNDVGLMNYINKLVPVVTPLPTIETIRFLKGEGTYAIRDKSMETQFPLGCTIVVSEIKDRNIIISGNCYLLIDLNNQAIVRKVYHTHEQHYTLVALNEKQYPAFERAHHEVAQLYSIQSVITYL